MIGHETVSVTNPVVSFVDVLEGIQEVLAITVIPEDGFLLVAAGCHMIYSTGVFDTERTSHEANIAWGIAKCKEKDLTLYGPIWSPC